MGGVRTKTSMIMTTRKAYFKDGVEVSRPRSLVYSGSTYVPPKDDILIAAGYEIREVEIPEAEILEPDMVEEDLIEQPIENEVVEAPKQTYEQRVVELIRLHYSVDDELAVLRQRDIKTEEFEEYNAYCENCKTIARVEFGLQEVKVVPEVEEPLEGIEDPLEDIVEPIE